mmetsp:Transcript_9362/g.23615  ORF Transcript_9362/g.23615 Transcript_9362/m.23615 type:complete len:234 (+) Transcript_9362:866-1567(+)
MVQCQRYLSNIKPHHTLFETTHALEVKEELPALAILGDHVQLVTRLECKHERNYERVRNFRHYTAFRLRVLHLVAAAHVVLLDHLHRVHSRVIRPSGPYQEHFAKRALPNNLHEIKVRHTCASADTRGAAQRTRCRPVLNPHEVVVQCAQSACAIPGGSRPALTHRRCQRLRVLRHLQEKAHLPGQRVQGKQHVYVLLKCILAMAYRGSTQCPETRSLLGERKPPQIWDCLLQ